MYNSPYNKEEDSKDLQDLIKEIKYIPETGELFWIVPGVHRKLDVPIDQGKSRYKVITFRQIRYHQHLLIWYIFNGIYPIGKEVEIDHINQNTKDNRIENLRLVTSKENSRNKPMRRDNHTGVTGVYFENYTQKYRASIIDLNGKNIRSKRFGTIDEAKQWRDSKIKEFGYTENHGRELSKLPYRKK